MSVYNVFRTHSYRDMANPAIISLESPNKKVNKNDAFEVKFGIGQVYNYQEAELWIYTEKITIMLADGTEVGK